MSALRLMAHKAVFHLVWERNYTVANPAYAKKPTAAELQKEIHDLIQVLSFVKMYFPLFRLSRRFCRWCESSILQQQLDAPSS